MYKTLMQCINCSKTIRSDNKGGQCRKCRSTCPCGNFKDYRADICRFCHSKQKALAQWSDPLKSQRIREGLKQGGLDRRRRYEDLRLEHFKMIRQLDGRRFAFYWTHDNRRRYEYRYRWVWKQAHGDIPAGYHVHHIDNDCTNDVLDNLELLTGTEHRKLHMTSEVALAMRKQSKYRPLS